MVLTWRQGGTKTKQNKNENQTNPERLETRGVRPEGSEEQKGKGDQEIQSSGLSSPFESVPSLG